MGNILWEVDLGQPSSISSAYDVIQTHNGDVVATGFSGFTQSTEQDLHVLRLTDLSLAVSESLGSIETNVFPNPTKGLVRIELNEKISDGRVLLFNDTGSLLTSQEISQQMLLELDITPFPAGLYLVQIMTGKEAYWTKIMKY